MTHLATLRHTLIFAIFGLAALGLSACGGGGGSTPAATPEKVISLASASRGFYRGSATVKVAGGDLVIGSPDLLSIVDEKTFFLAYKGSVILLYKGTFTDVTDTSFKADIRVFKNGYFIATATIDDGVIDTANQTLSGTITATANYTATDYASTTGKIALSYDSSNNVAPFTYSNSSWQDGTTSPTGGVRFNAPTNINITITPNAVPAELICDATNTDTTNMAYSQTGRIRKFLSSPLTVCSENTLQGQQLNGYFTNYNGNGTDDDTMLFMISDDNYAYVGIFSCLNGTGKCFN